jgi:hypothetical protein
MPSILGLIWLWRRILAARLCWLPLCCLALCWLPPLLPRLVVLIQIPGEVRQGKGTFHSFLPLGVPPAGRRRCDLRLKQPAACGRSGRAARGAFRQARAQRWHTLAASRRLLTWGAAARSSPPLSVQREAQHNTTDPHLCCA